jgi:hypothetical protein
MKNGINLFGVSVNKVGVSERAREDFLRKMKFYLKTFPRSNPHESNKARAGGLPELDFGEEVI